jgi:predicted metal-dependent phosphoesterase TrpH
MVRQKSLAAFAIADHDTLDGYREVRSLVTSSDPEVVPGVELSAAEGGDDLHILAYLFDPEDSPLNDALVDFQQRRNQRGRLIVQKLRDVGIDIPFEAVMETADNSTLGRPHIADTMYRLGATRSYQEGFDKHLGKGCPAYVPKSKMTPTEAIELIHNAGGVAVLAHPLVDGLVKHIEKLVELGLDGIEVWHYSVGPKDIKRLKRLADRWGLLISGGSDFHGRGEQRQSPGSQEISIEHLNGLKARSMEIRGRT